MLQDLPRKGAKAGVVSALSCAALALASCAAPAEGSGETVPANIAGAQPSSAGLSALGDVNTTRKTQRPEAPAQLLVTDVRVGSHATFDRVVFDLEGAGTPGWFADYTKSPAQQGSGHPVAVAGDAALNINIDGTAYPFELDQPDPQIGTVEGAGKVVEVVSAGTFEGHSQFIIGLQSELPYSVQVLEDPQRVVVDILSS